MRRKRQIRRDERQWGEMAEAKEAEKERGETARGHG